MTTPDTTNQSLSIAELEAAYDALAEAIDRTGHGKAELFLAKLALLNANAIGQVEKFREHIEIALLDL